jgi:hypothetical protein
MRLTLATVASILSVALISGIAIGISYLSSGDSSGIGIGLAIVIAFTVSAATGVLVVGLPLHYALAKRERRRFLPYFLAGALVPCAVIFAFRPFGDSIFRLLVGQALISATLGAACAFVFWLIAVRFAKNAT